MGGIKLGVFEQTDLHRMHIDQNTEIPAQPHNPNGIFSQQKDAKTILHWLFTLVGAFYLSFVIIGKQLIEISYYDTIVNGTSHWELYCIIGLLSFLFFLCLLLFVSKNGKALFHIKTEQGKLSFRFFCSISIPVLLLYLLFWLIDYPGGISPDNNNQWQQITLLTFNDHHPAFHTFLLLWLTKLCNSYSFIILAQIVAFACGVGYLASTLDSWGFPRWCVILTSVILALGFSTRHILQYAWKDTALSLFFLFFLSHMINIFLSHGSWLQSPSHWLSSAILLVCITLVRHNAFFFTAPLLALSFFFFSKKACLKLGLIVCILIVIVKGPVYSYYGVKPAPDTYRELVGLPMTILSAVYGEAPREQIPDDLYDFFSSEFADHRLFREKHVLGDFNSVKWSFDFSEEKMQKLPPLELLKMTWNAMRSNGQLALYSVVELTDMVYDPCENEGWIAGVNSSPWIDETPSPSYDQVPNMHAWTRSKDSDLFWNVSVRPLADRCLNHPITRYFTSNYGFLLLVMLLSCYVSFQKVHGWRSLWLVFPIMIYNFGTMLLLCGNDGRFFHFNCLAAYPIALVLLSTQSQTKPISKTTLQ